MASDTAQSLTVYDDKAKSSNTSKSGDETLQRIKYFNVCVLTENANMK